MSPGSGIWCADQAARAGRRGMVRSVEHGGWAGMTGRSAEPAGRPGAATSLGDLRALIQALPVPTAPPAFPQKEAALGLALMDLSLRLDHILRLSEHLTLLDRGHMTRSISVDIDLEAISGIQRESLLVPAET